MIVAWRPADADDQPFLEALYAASRAGEFVAVGLGGPELAALLAQQFAAQSRGFATTFPRAEHLIVLADGDRVGRLVLDEAADRLHIVDVLVDVAARGAGVGTAVVRRVIERGDASRKMVTLRVDPRNPARRLYERLGFREVHGTSTASSLLYCRAVQANTAS